MTTRANRRAHAAVIVALSCIYAAGINPYPLPGTYDNVVYLEAAESLARGEGVRFQGDVVVDWPPGFAFFLALPLWLGVSSVASPLVAGKFALLPLVAFGLFLVRRRLEAEGHAHPLLATALFGLLPTALLTGTRLLSEWLFLVLAFAFLEVFERCRSDAKRSARFALLAGVLLGASILTRYLGVMLAAPVVLAGVAALARRTGKPGRELRNAGVVLGVAAIPFGIWALFVRSSLHSGAGEARYLPEMRDNLAWQLGLSSGSPGLGGWLGDVASRQLANAEALARAVADLLFEAPTLLEAGLGDGALARVAVLVPACLAALGFAARVRAKESQPADAWVAATLVFLLATAWIRPRFLLPIAPYLVSYFIGGCEVVVGSLARLSEPARGSTLRIALAGWAAALLIADGVLLVRGSEGAGHGGLALAASPTPGAFYRADWRALYEASQVIAAQPGNGAVSVGVPGAKYVRAFSGRAGLPFPPREPVAWVLLAAEDAVAEERSELAGSLTLEDVWRSESLVLFRIAPQLASRAD